MTTTVRPVRSLQRARVVALGVILVAVCAAVLLAGTQASAQSLPENWQFQDLDGPGVPGGNGRSSDPVQPDGSATIRYNGVPHVFERAGDVLRHAWAAPAGWQFESLDGPGVPGGNGRTSDPVGNGASAVVFGSDLHVFYSAPTTGVLRHAWYSRAAGQWFAESLDGTGVPGGNGRTSDPVGGPTASIVWGGTPHVFYSNLIRDDLLHGWWTGTRWQFETLDGEGGPNGRVNAILDPGSAAVSVPGALTLQVFYRNVDSGRLRQAGYSPSAGRWQFQDLDGPGVSGGAGRQDVSTGIDPTAVAYRGQPHVFYGNADDELRQAFVNSDGVWLFTTLETPAGCGGCKPGGEPAAALFDGRPAVSHYDSEFDRLLLARWTGTVWENRALDGQSTRGGAGRTTNAVGRSSSLLQYGVQLTIQYVDTTENRLRQAWFGPAAPSVQNLPTVTGSAAVGATLTASDGTWSNSPTSFTYRWDRCPVFSLPLCSTIPGATAQTYVPTVDDVGFSLRVFVTATNAVGPSAPAGSVGTAPVVDVPVNTVVPTIDDTTPAVGDTLAAQVGTWTGDPTSYAYQWRRCSVVQNGDGCTDIDGATSVSYTVTADDLDFALVVAVTATNAAGTSAPAQSAPTAPVTGGPTVTSVVPNFGSPTGGTSVTITGTDFTGATAVTFGGTAAVSFTVDSSTQVTSVAPAGTGTVDVSVTTPLGTGSATDAYTYVVDPDLTVLQTAGATPYDTGQSVAVGADGGMVVTGFFSGTATFGAGQPDETSVTATGLTNAYVVSYTAAGALRWVRTAPAGTGSNLNRGTGVSVGADGSVAVTGYFNGTATFGSGQPNETTLTSAAFFDVFVAKYDSVGALEWARQGSGPDFDQARSVSVSPDGSVAVVGDYGGTVTFGAGQPNETTLTGPGFTDVFVASYDTDGFLRWARSGGGTDFEAGLGVATGADGSVAATGYFNGTATFGAGDPNETTLTSQGASDVFVASYDASGVLQWAAGAGSTTFDEGRGVAVGVDGTVAVAGFFSRTIVFGAVSVEALGPTDAFVVTYDATGTVQWARNAGGAGGTYANGVDVGTDGLIVLTGFFENATTFGTGQANVTTLQSSGPADLFVAPYSATGELLWARRAGGTGAEIGSGVAVGADGAIAVAGEFNETATFCDDAGDGYPGCAGALVSPTTATARGVSTDIALLRFGPAPMVPDNTEVPVVSGTVAVGGTLSTTDGTWTSDPTSFTYQWQRCPVLLGGLDLLGGGCTDIDGATESTYVVSVYDVDFTLRSRVVAANAAGSSEPADSVETEVVPPAPLPSVDVAQTAGGEGAETEGRAVASGPAGEMVVTGSFTGTSTFGFAQPFSTTLTSDGGTDAYVASYGASGQLRWATRAGGTGEDFGAAVTVAADGGIVVTGTFSGTATFGDGAGPVTLVASGASDVFVAAYDAAGVLRWATNAGGSGDDAGNGVSAAADGTSFVTGTFSGEAVFGEGAAQVVLESLGDADVFVASYDTSGVLRWAQRAGGPLDDVGRSVAVGPGGAVVVTGAFSSFATFGPSTVLPGFGDPSMFLASYTDAGALSWATAANGNAVIGNAVAVGADGNPAVTGVFQGVTTFGEGPAAVTLEPSGTFASFVASYDTAGTLRWVQMIDGEYVEGRGVVVTPDGRVTVTGAFVSAATFDPGGPGETTLGGLLNLDLYLAAYAADGTFGGVLRPAIAVGFVGAGGMSIDAAGNLALAGGFADQALFCFGYAVYETAECSGPVAPPSTPGFASAKGPLDQFLLRFTYTPTPPVVPAVVVAPVVSGSAEVGQSLSTTPGAWANIPVGIDHTWERCDAAGENCTTVGSSAPSYEVTAEDVGSTLRSTVSASNAAGSTQLSVLTAVVPAPAPVNTSGPVLSGLAEIGETLSTTDGTWLFDPTSFAYRWQRCDILGASCIDIDGATSATYDVVVEDAGLRLRATVTASNAAGPSVPANSPLTLVVPAPPVPVNIGTPGVNGEVLVGSTLSVNVGLWTNDPTSFAYQWQRCTIVGTACIDLDGETGATYDVVADDGGSTLRVVVTASNAVGSSTPTPSAPTSVVPGDLPTVTSVSPQLGDPGGTVTISGTGFTGVTAVRFGTVPATSFNSVDDSTITAVLPNAGSSTVDVGVTTPAGEGVLVDGYTYGA